jgi:hypothetical protein
LCGKVVFNPLLLIVFSLNFRFLVAGLKLCVAFKKLRESAANFTGDLCQIVACFLQVLVDGNAPLDAFVGTFAESECRDWINFLLVQNVDLTTIKGVCAVDCGYSDLVERCGQRFITATRKRSYTARRAHSH